MLQAPLFGMLSWVNSSEVRRWLQTKIADPQSLRCTSSGQDLLSNSMSRPNSDAQLTGAQDGMPGLPLTSHHSDHAWVSLTCQSHYMILLLQLLFCTCLSNGSAPWNSRAMLH